MTLKAKHKQQKKQNRTLKEKPVGLQCFGIQKIKCRSKFWFDMQEFRLTPLIKHFP